MSIDKKIFFKKYFELQLYDIFSRKSLLWELLAREVKSKIQLSGELPRAGELSPNLIRISMGTLGRRRQVIDIIF